MILVRVAVHDRRLDLAADAAVRPDRHRSPQVGAEKLRLGADRARTLDPRERLHPDVRSQRDRTIHRVEHRVRIDPRRLVNPQTIDGPHQRQLGQVPVAHADLVRRREIAVQMLGVLGDQVPRAVDPLATDVQAPVLRGHPVKPGVDTLRLERDRIVRPHPRQRGPPVAQPDPRPVTIGHLESDRRHPAAVGNDHRPSRQPIPIVDHHVRHTLPLNVNKVRPDQATPPLRSGTDSNRA